jgi:hypothetical protein
MAIPGFSAEISLYKSRKTHPVPGITSNQHSQVIPQMRISCLVDSLSQYGACLSGAGPACEYWLHRNLWICGLQNN